MTLSIAAAAALLSNAKGFSRFDEIGKKLVFVFDRYAMEGVGSIRVFGCDPKERAADDVGPVYHAFDSG